MEIAEEHFSLLWPRHVEGLINLLCELRRAFDGDLDSVLICAVVGAALLPADRLPASFSYADLLKRRSVDFRKPLNTLSIAQATGIPRETVRRKLAVLEAKEWLARDGDGYWQMGARGAEDLRAMTLLSLSYISGLAEGIGWVMAKGKDP